MILIQGALLLVCGSRFTRRSALAGRSTAPTFHSAHYWYNGNRLTKDYMAAELRVFINKTARTGRAAFVDDDVEPAAMVQIKPGWSEA
jgi:hypothetical protein